MNLPEIYNVIDIGSNSVRLMRWQNGVTLYKELIITRLSDKLSLTGSLSPAAISRTANAVAGFAQKAKQSGGRIFAFATDAVRSASNGCDFVAAVYDLCGITVDVVSGDTEAELGFIGASYGHTGSVAIIDIGGGSVELVAGSGTVTYRKSLPLGVVRLMDISSGSRAKAQEYIDSLIGQYGAPPRCLTLMGIGGTVTSLAAMQLKLKVYDPKKVHGHLMTRRYVSDITDTLFDMDLEERKTIAGLSPDRADVIHYGSLVLLSILDYLGADSLTVSENDNLEGYLLSFGKRK